MWGTSLALVVTLCVMGNVGVSGDRVMGKLHWCNPLCMCKDATQEIPVQCFERTDIYELLEMERIQVFKLQRANWKLEDQLTWCNSTCLCHQSNRNKVFQCTEEDSLRMFISDKIGDEYFYTDEELAEELKREMEEEARALEQKKRMEERRKNRRKGKARKRVKNRPQVVAETTTTTPSTTTSTTPSTTMEMITTYPPTEALLVTTPSVQIMGFWDSSASQSAEIIQEASKTPMTDQTMSHPYQHDPIRTNAIEGGYEEDGYEGEQIDDDEYGDEEEEEAEPLPKQEAVAASPAVTAMQPPTRHQPTASSHAATREGETMAPKVSAVLEVPIQRKTVASEVSQDLDELGSAVMQIKSDVVLNQRILLVTVAVAGIAMLGVIVMAVHSCLASKRQAAVEERKQKESPKEDNHVTKVNLEEAW